MRPAETHIKLAALWLFILLNIIFRDLHQFVMPGFLETVMTGHFNGMEITPELMLIGGIVVSVPISMVPLSLLLKRRFARPLTFVAMAGIVAIAWRWKPAPTTAGLHNS